MTELLDIYAVPYRENQIEGVDQVPVVDPHTLDLMLDPATLIIVDVRLPEETIATIGEQLSSGYNKTECAITNVLGDIRFFLWHSPEYAGLCQISGR